MSAWRQLLEAPSKRFALYLSAFCIGIAIGPLLLPVRYDLLLGAAIVALAVGAVVKHQTARAIVFLVVLLLLGGTRYAQSFPPRESLAAWDQQSSSVRVSGIVAGEVERRATSQRVTLRNVSLADESVHGRLLATFPKYPTLHYGDQLTFSCAVERPEPIEGFAYDKFLESRGVYAVCYRPSFTEIAPSDSVSPVGAVLAVKGVITDRLALLVPEPHAAFLSGLLFGGSSSLSKDLRDDFSVTGTSHILAASGFNVSLFTLVFLGWVLGTPLGRTKSLILTSVLLIAYVIMAGATPAVMRAALMASVLLVGIALRRKASMLNVLLFVAALMLLVNPRILLDDVGFQLSFAATAALVFVAPRWERFFRFLPKTFGIRESVVASMAAIILTLPIVFWHFGSVSIVAPVINLLILPIIPLLMAIMFLALAVGFLHTGIGSLLAIPAWALSSIILHLIRWFASLPYASLSTEHADVLAVTSLVILVMGLLFARSSFSYDRPYLAT